MAIFHIYILYFIHPIIIAHYNECDLERSKVNFQSKAENLFIIYKKKSIIVIFEDNSM